MNTRVRASDLVGCRFKLRQRQRYPEITSETPQQLEAARAAVLAQLPIKRALGDGAGKRFVRVDAGGDAGATARAMRGGAHLIVNAKLRGIVAGIAVDADVDVLVRDAAAAEAGATIYAPVLVSNHRVARPHPQSTLEYIPVARLGLGKKLEVKAKARHHTIDGYRLALAHLLLAQHSAGWGGLVGQDRQRAYVVHAEKYVEPLLRALALPTPDEPRRLKQCATCRFWPVCEPRLRELDDISLVLPGAKADGLRARGITTVQALIDANLGEASRVAAAWRAGLPVLRRPGVMKVPRADVEIDVDMEAYLDQGAYLWGAFDGTTYHAFVTWDDVGGEAEQRNFTAFWQWLMRQREQAHAEGKTFAAYCYAAGGENYWLRSSAARFFGVGSEAEQQVQRFIASDEWVDVFAHVRTHLVGTDGLGLKVLGPVVGFHWEDDDVDGERSVELRLEARHGDVEAREMLLRYNEDDCRATRAVRDFLSAGAPGVPLTQEQSR